MESQKAMKIFKDELNTAVFTTKFVINDKKLITYVSHDIEDGAWQFFSDDAFENFEDVAMIVGLGEIIKFDETLLNLADLPLGYTATRNSLADTWSINKVQDD